MDYLGEHLLPGQLGHFFIVLSLIASVVATFSSFQGNAVQQYHIRTAAYWKSLARYCFIIETISVVAIIQHSVLYNP